MASLVSLGFVLVDSLVSLGFVLVDSLVSRGFALVGSLVSRGFALVDSLVSREAVDLFGIDIDLPIWRGLRFCIGFFGIGDDW